MMAGKATQGDDAEVRSRPAAPAPSSTPASAATAPATAHDRREDAAGADALGERRLLVGRGRAHGDAEA